MTARVLRPTSPLRKGREETVDAAGARLGRPISQPPGRPRRGAPAACTASPHTGQAGWGHRPWPLPRAVRGSPREASGQGASSFLTGPKRDETRDGAGRPRGSRCACLSTLTRRPSPRPLSFPCGVWTHVGCWGRGAWGRAPHCAGSQAAGGACWAEGSLGLCRSEGDTGVRWRPTRACRRPRLGPPGLGWVLLTSAAGQGAAGSPQLLRRFAGPPGGLSPRPRHRLV